MEREKRYPTEGFHLGKLIKAELTRQGRSITCQAKKRERNGQQVLWESL